MAGSRYGNNRVIQVSGKVVHFYYGQSRSEVERAHEFSSGEKVPETLIQTTGLTRDFGTVRAVDDLSFEVPVGSIFGFLGPNGAGKTTTIHLLLGLLEPTRGSARVMGFDTARQSDEIRSRSGPLQAVEADPELMLKSRHVGYSWQIFFRESGNMESVIWK